jgi:hypothetical protein
MGMKSRLNWSTNACFRKCANRDVDGKCDDCVCFRNYEPLKGEGTEAKDGV